MLAVLTYWQLSEDEADLLDHLLSTGNVVAMTAYGAKSRDGIMPLNLRQYLSETNVPQLFFGLEEFARSANIESIIQDGERKFVLDYMTSCLVSYCRGSIRDGNRLTESNLVAHYHCLSKDKKAVVAKDPRFVKWAKSIFRWVRKKAPKQIEYMGGLYEGTDRVKHALERREIEVVPY